MNDDKEKKKSAEPDTVKDNGEKSSDTPREKKEGKNFFQKISQKFFKSKKDKTGFISAKESKRISKANAAITKEYEKRKKRKNVPESEYVTTMKNPKNIVEFENLHTYFFTDAGTVKAVGGVTFSIPQGSTVGVVGESGCGKSVTSFSLMQLVAAPTGQVIDGSEIRFRSTSYKEKSGKKVPIYEYEIAENDFERILTRPKLNKNGKKIPVYEYETIEDGTQIIKTQPKLNKNGKPVLDKSGNPVKENVQKMDENGKLLFEIDRFRRDKIGNIIIENVQKTDENGKPVFETIQKIEIDRKKPVYEYEAAEDGTERIKTAPKLDKKGKPVLDKDGNPVIEKVQKIDDNGKPLFETVNKGTKKVPVLEYETIKKGTQIIKERQKVNKKGRPLFNKDGSPIIEKVQKTDENGILLFEMEEKVYNIAKMPTEVMRKIRGREIAMIFQEPMTSLNPIFTIGRQLDEVVLLHIPGATKESAKKRSFEMLKLVGIIPENVYDRYPHELSGGMRQRVCIAMVLSCTPKLIIADEPTTALDVTIQAQILDLLRDIKDKISGSIMLITHDLGVIAEMADFVVVMYAGRIIEMGTAKEIFDNPMHPYTIGLQKSKPSVNKQVDRLYSIPGNVPNPINMPTHCYFKGRCEKKIAACDGDYPCMIDVSETHKVSCHLYIGKEGK